MDDGDYMWIVFTTLLNIIIIYNIYINIKDKKNDYNVSGNTLFTIIILWTIFTLVTEGFSFGGYKDAIKEKEYDMGYSIIGSTYNLVSLFIMIIICVIIVYIKEIEQVTDIIGFIQFLSVLLIAVIVMASFKYVKRNEYIEFVKKNKTPEII